MPAATQNHTHVHTKLPRLRLRNLITGHIVVVALALHNFLTTSILQTKHTVENRDTQEGFLNYQIGYKSNHFTKNRTVLFKYL